MVILFIGLAYIQDQIFKLSYLVRMRLLESPVDLQKGFRFTRSLTCKPSLMKKAKLIKCSSLIVVSNVVFYYMFQIFMNHTKINKTMYKETELRFLQYLQK